MQTTLKFLVGLAVMATAAQASPVAAPDSAPNTEFLTLNFPAQPSKTPGCTTTVFTNHPFVFGPTRTVYTKTETVTRPIDCGVCTAVAEIPLPLGVGPVVFFTTTVSAATPTTVTTFTCANNSTSTSTAPPHTTW